MKRYSNALTKSDLITQGFNGFTTIRELQSGPLARSEELNRRGVYAVVCLLTYTPSFIDPALARRNHNVISPWSLEKLKKKWVFGVEVLYFGRAGANIKKHTLRNRLNEFIRHSQGKTKNHREGEILWQLRGYENFEIGYLPTDNPEQEESRLLDLFSSKTGKLPFANRIRARSRERAF